MPKKVLHHRAPITIEFPEGVDDDTYLNLAAAIRAVADLVPVDNFMSLDEDLAEAYDDVDPLGPARLEKYEERDQARRGR